MTLVGLVSKNGILIVEFANKLQLQGLSKLEAVREAAMTRLRPILMISAATIAGHFPLTLVTGPGAAARNSIGSCWWEACSSAPSLPFLSYPPSTCSSPATTARTVSARRPWQRQRSHRLFGTIPQNVDECLYTEPWPGEDE